MPTMLHRSSTVSSASSIASLSQCATNVIEDSVDRYMNAFIRDIGRPRPRRRDPSCPCPGARLDGRYQLVELLGHGGMGAVWKARDQRLRRTVALKIASLPGELDRSRFVREARICSRIRHRNVVEIYDVGTADGGLAYYTMELVEGRDLSTVLADEPPGAPVLVLVLRQVASALDRVHRFGVVHRDVKPSNVVIDESSQRSTGGALCKLVDFGLAVDTELGAADDDEPITTPGQFLGTPRYMSPEQIRGATLDHKSDVYGFGCLAYEVLTGAPPFASPSMPDLLQQHLVASPEPMASAALDRLPPTTASTLEAIVSRCLAKRAADRPAMSEVKQAFASMTLVARRTGGSDVSLARRALG